MLNIAFLNTNQVLAETNQGYMNSNVALEVVRLCAEEATIDDTNDALVTLTAFRGMKGSDPAAAKLRNSADAAVLLVGSFDSCGVAYFHTLGSGFTLSVVKKSCALGYYSFGHEVGHSMGLAHNPEETTNTAFSQGHGHLIQKGSNARGYRTILAYSAQGHRDRRNYYSNPAVLLPETGTPTGEVGISNNAAVLNMNRFQINKFIDTTKVFVNTNPITNTKVIKGSGWLESETRALLASTVCLYLDLHCWQARSRCPSRPPQQQPQQPQQQALFLQIPQVWSV